ALERSLREAVRSGSRRIGPEHVLLGVLRPPAVSVQRILSRLDVDAERLVALVHIEIASARTRCFL
ncbi:MAG: Clp protease N-terminal domain-containing protein, partial [Solirubrobacteraceae bacterium]